MFLQIKKHGGNNEKTPNPKGAAYQLPWPGVVYLPTCFEWKTTWMLDQLREAVSQAGGATL